MPSSVQRGVQLAGASRRPAPGLAAGGWGRRCGGCAPLRRCGSRRALACGAVQLERRRAAARGGGRAARPAAAAGRPRGPLRQRRQRFFDRQQLARLHQPQQPDFQVQARLQRELQIAEQVQRELQVARQVLFGKLRGDLRQPLALGGGGGDQPRVRRRRSAPPAGCGSSAPARGRSAAGCGRCAPVRPPPRACAAESASASACVTWSSESSEKAPSSARTSAALRASSPQQAMAWSSAESESRTLPSPACASTASASASASMPSWPQIHSMRATRSSKSTERKLKCWQREAMVAGILCASVVHSTKTTHSRRLLEGLQQRVEGLAGDLVRFVDDEDLVAVARGPVADVLAQLAHLVDAAVGGRVDFDHVHACRRRRSPGSWRTRRRASAVGPSTQFRQRARMRATVVLPVPRWPEKM